MLEAPGTDDEEDRLQATRKSFDASNVATARSEARFQTMRTSFPESDCHDALLVCGSPRKAIGFDHSSVKRP